MSKAIATNHKSTTHEEQYFHIRVPHVGKNGKRYKAATACVRNVTSFAEQDAGKASYYCVAVIRCSEEDNFNRQQGRTLSRRKLLNTPIANSYGQIERPTYEDVLAIYTSI